MGSQSHLLTICFYTIPEVQAEAKALETLFSKVSEVQLLLPTSENELLESPLFGHIDICLVLFTPLKVLNLILTRNPIQWIHSFSSGVEAYMTAELATSPILMTNAKGLFSNTLAEFALTAMLHFAKRGEQLMRNKEERQWKYEEMSVLYGKTVLMIGYGDIGQAVGRMASTAFQMRVIAVQRTPRPCQYAEYTTNSSFPTKTEYTAEIHSLESLPTLLSQADIVVMCLPDTPSTYHLLSTAELALLRPTAILINLGRGNQLDESALMASLQAGKLAGAALDVTKNEPLQDASRLWQCPNLLLSLHCAGLYDELAEDTVEQFWEELQAFRLGELRESKRLVNKKLGY